MRHWNYRTPYLHGATGPAGSNGTNGATGAAGPSGVANATLPLTYNSGTQTVATTSLNGLRVGHVGAADTAGAQGDITSLIAGLYPSVSNNLSDLANALTAAQNLGVPFSQHIAKSAAFTAAQRGAVYEVTTGSSNLAVTLPTAANGYFFAVRKADAGTGLVTVNGWPSVRWAMKSR